MGLFSKSQADDDAVVEELSENTLVNPEYREELKKIGREHFKDLIEDQSENLEQEVDSMMERVTADVKVYATKRIDALIGRLNAEVTNQLNDRISEYNRVSAESQELVAQSLARNAQMVHEKFQQMSVSMQQVVANQEVMMATVFQDSKTQASAIQAEQSKILEQLRQTEAATRGQADELNQSLKKTVTDQAAKLDAIYQENLATVESTKEAQAQALEKLKATTDTLQAQHQQLEELLESSIANQKAMVIDVINDNMSRIIEHYLIGALGEQSSLREQMPQILESLEENKKAMVDDMEL